MLTFLVRPKLFFAEKLTKIADEPKILSGTAENIARCPIAKILIGPSRTFPEANP
jgi:hypothetical protein